jgi:hypothetical protein
VVSPGTAGLESRGMLRLAPSIHVMPNFGNNAGYRSTDGIRAHFVVEVQEFPAKTMHRNFLAGSMNLDSTHIVLIKLVEMRILKGKRIHHICYNFLENRVFLYVLN